MPGKFNMWFSQTKVAVEGGCYIVALRQGDKEEQHWGKNESFVQLKLKSLKSIDLSQKIAKHLLTETAHMYITHLIYSIVTYRRDGDEEDIT